MLIARLGILLGLYYSRILSPGLDPSPITAMTTDAAGNVYVTGFTESAGFPTTPGVVQPKFGGGVCQTGIIPMNVQIFPCSDAFVTKLDPKGNVVFSTFLGGNGLDAGTSIAVDAAGNIYVAGTTARNTSFPPPTPAAFPTTPGAAFTNASPSGSDGFVAKLNASGTALVYSTLIPGMASGAIAVDSAGNVYFGGTRNVATRVIIAATPGAYQTSPGGGFIAKLNPGGSAFVYATYLGSVFGAQVDSIAIDSSGSVYVTGEASASDFPATPGAFEKTLPGVQSAFVTKLNASGSALEYSTYLGGNGTDVGDLIRVDSEGNAYVLGRASSSDFPITPTAFQSSISLPSWGVGSESDNRFLAKVNARGTGLVYSTYFADAGAFDVDAAGNAFVAGRASRGFPVSTGALQRCMAGGEFDAIVAQLSPEGALAAATYLGGSGSDGPGAVPQGFDLEPRLQAIAVRKDGSVYVAGGTNSPDFPGAQGATAGPFSIFVSKLQIADPNKKDLPCMALALQNSASFTEGPIAPGELVTLRGLGFGPDAGAGMQLDSSGGISSELAGVQVFFDDIRTPLLYAQSRQINVQAPWELAGRTTQVHVVFNGESSNMTTVPVVPAAPAIFHLDSISSQGAIVNQDGTLNSAANPAKRGSVVSLYGTGGGLTSPAGVTGGFTPLGPLEFLAQPVSVRLGGVPFVEAEVLYAGAAPTQSSGLFQINFRIPASLPLPGPANVFVAVTVGTATSTDNPFTGTTIAVE